MELEVLLSLSEADIIMMGYNALKSRNRDKIVDVLYDIATWHRHHGKPKNTEVILEDLEDAM